MRRIKWVRDEYILVLNLYYKYRTGAPSKKDPELINYSNLLRSMNPSEAESNPKFRNVNGIYLRLMNYRSCDPYWLNQGKKGMDSGSKGKCKEIWEEFDGHEDYVKDLAVEIKLKIANKTYDLNKNKSI